MNKEQEIKERVNMLANYLISSKHSMRKMSKELGIHLSTISSDLHERINLIEDENKIEQVQFILKNQRKRNFNEYKIEENKVILYLKKRDGRIFECYIDLEDLDKLIELNWSWSAAWYPNVQGYYVAHTEHLGTIEGKHRSKTHLLHYYIMNCPDGYKVDHINHNTLDNRKENLRISLNDENTKHRKGKNSNNKSGYRNVCWIKNRWYVQLMIDGKNTVLGKFKYDELEQAGKFAEEMRQKYYGEYSGNN